ncbi:universal stress protein [Sphingobacterium olei]|uniref:Universal stress protein n=1 Tax=Sphingobacterium olei TaxID=2571155 RepID=A0A4U0NJ13_9SPHI|nr:universal stress protein [Sphingobacterium olei]TJZ53692.1 universal stress protein [Sphingobacterium olei]
MKSIIVATDFSSGANNATIYACNFASDTGTKIVLFHLYHMSIHALNSRAPASAIDDLMKSSRDKLLKEADKLSKHFKIEVNTIWRMGDFKEELQNAITSAQADIVVMGMASKSLEQDLLGNTTTSAVHSLKFPVLAVPANAIYQKVKTILFACEITRGIHKTVLDKVKDVAAKVGATIEVFHVSKKITQLANGQQGISLSKTFEEGLQGTNYYYKNVESDKIIDAIQDEIKQISANLVIMIPYRYGFWESMVHRSKTMIMASRSEIPLLSLPL